MQLIAMECKYIDFYLEQGYCVCLWNYRGYGQSTGTPSLSKNEVDVLDLYEALTSDGYSLKISHGYSIGGPVAIYVACVRSMNMLIADRTFGSIDLVRGSGYVARQGLWKRVLQDNEVDILQVAAGLYLAVPED